MNIFSKLPLIATACIALAIANVASAVDLDFSKPVGTPNATDYFHLGPYFNAASVNFLGVATVGAVTVDMKVTANVTGNYKFYGTYGDYNQALNQPEGDIGSLYYNTAPGSGAMDYTMEFYVGGTNFGTRYTVSDLSLMIYDVDGEPGQTESFKAYASDGFLSYQLSSSNSLTPSLFNGGVNFLGGGTDIAETNASGAVILNYGPTDKVTLRFESTTASGSGNGVFSAIDGDLSGKNGTWTPAIPVPEPSSAFLVLVCGFFGIIRRRR